jgi:peptide/nickel transport system substrate-binding protein
MQGSTSSVDPHWMTSPANWTINRHIFEPLVNRNNNGAIEPWLATSWKRIDDTTWEFKLRNDVKFQDGSPFTADDVVFTYDRLTHVPNAPNPFTAYAKYFAKVEALDPYTVRLTTKSPAPALLQDLAYILIVSKNVGSTATTEDYNSGKGAIGTGPYMFGSFALNDKTVLKRNPNYWGEKEPWDTVTFRVISNDASRTAALLAGDVDLIESVPTIDIERLKANDRLTIYSKPTGRIAYFGFDAGDEALASGRIVGIDGQPLKTNPLGDKRVREALKLVVDLDQFVSKIYQDQAIATGQYLLPDVFGFIPDLKPWKPDPVKARQLLEESGWADKFKITMGVSDGIFQNAVKVAQGIAQAWTKLGVPTNVISMPYPVFLNQRNDRKLPVQLMTRQNTPLVADAFYSTVVHSWGAVKGDDGMGSSNYTRYSNPEVDKLIETALATMDDGKREKMYQDAGRIAVEDSQINPLWLINETTATKSNLTFIPRFDRMIFAMNIRAK